MSVGNVDLKPVVCTGCSQQCGLLLHLEDGRPQRLTGDPGHPSSQGFICPKGTSALSAHLDPQRVHRPLKRIGERGSGRWEEISWDRALDEIAGAISRLAEAYGRETLAYSYGTLHAADWGIGERFMNLFGSPNTVGQDKVCYAPNALGEVLTYGWGPTMYTAPLAGVTGCEVLWGFRPSASMPLLWSAMTAARKAGTKTIVIDPVETHEARLADLWLQILPGTDAALAMGLIHVIVAEELYDREFVDAKTVGFAALRRRAADYSPEQVAAVTGVAPEQITAAARMLATNGPAIVHGSNGLCQAGAMAVQAGRALACLIAITGNVGREGAHALTGPPRDLVANGDAVLCDELDPAQRRLRLGANEFPFIGNGYAEVAAALGSAWYGDRHALSWMATAHEPTLWRAIVDEEPYPVKALIVQCHNALGSAANAQAVARALTHENLELFVAHDLFINSTSRLADYVLPAAHWLEKPFYSAVYGYMGFAGDYIEANPAPLEVSAEHRSDYDLFRDLGRRLGQADRWPATAEDFWDSLLREASFSFAEVARHRGPLVGEAARSSPPRRDGHTREYGTPSGRIELASSLLASWGLDPLPGYHTMPIFDAARDRYSLVLTTGGREIQGFHQMAQQTEAFRRRHPHPVVSINPDTAHQLGIKDGDWVTLETPIGSVRQRARLTPTLAPTVVHADRWWYPERAEDSFDPFGFWATNINVCTDDAHASCDPVMGSWLLRALPCRLAVQDEESPQ
jgi:thiosulfate reductase / polysulfide reductase chain A